MAGLKGGKVGDGPARFGGGVFRKAGEDTSGGGGRVNKGGGGIDMLAGSITSGGGGKLVSDRLFGVGVTGSY